MTIPNGPPGVAECENSDCTGCRWCVPAVIGGVLAGAMKCERADCTGCRWCIPAVDLAPLARARLAVRLLLVELLDESLPAGELVRIARSVSQTLVEYRAGFEGYTDEVAPLQSPQRELHAFADAVVELLIP